MYICGMSSNLYKIAKEKGYKYLDGKIVGVNGHALSTPCSKSGYPRFSLRVGRLRKVIPAHRFVAYLKYGDKIFDEDLQVRHLDGDSTNFGWSNIAIGTKSENEMDKPEHVRRNVAIIASSYIKKYDKEEVFEYYLGCRSYKNTMEKFDIPSKGSLNYIIKCCRNNSV